jgi:hypothetical protein
LNNSYGLSIDSKTIVNGSSVAQSLRHENLLLTLEIAQWLLGDFALTTRYCLF